MCTGQKLTQKQIDLVLNQIREYDEISQRLWEKYHSQSMWSRICNWLFLRG